MPNAEVASCVALGSGSVSHGSEPPREGSAHTAPSPSSASAATGARLWSRSPLVTPPACIAAHHRRIVPGARSGGHPGRPPDHAGRPPAGSVGGQMRLTLGSRSYDLTTRSVVIG